MIGNHHHPNSFDCGDSLFLMPSYKDLILAYKNPGKLMEINSENFIFRIKYPESSKRSLNHLLNIYDEVIALQNKVCSGGVVNAKQNWVNRVISLGFEISIIVR